MQKRWQQTADNRFFKGVTRYMCSQNISPPSGKNWCKTLHHFALCRIWNSLKAEKGRIVLDLSIGTPKTQKNGTNALESLLWLSILFDFHGSVTLHLAKYVFVFSAVFILAHKNDTNGKRIRTCTITTLTQVTNISLSQWTFHFFFWMKTFCTVKKRRTIDEKSNHLRWEFHTWTTVCVKWPQEDNWQHQIWKSYTFLVKHKDITTHVCRLVRDNSRCCRKINPQ